MQSRSNFFLTFTRKNTLVNCIYYDTSPINDLLRYYVKLGPKRSEGDNSRRVVGH